MKISKAALNLLFFFSSVLITLLPAAASAGWISQDVPLLPERVLTLKGSRTVAVEPATSYPHIAYGGEALLHAYYDGVQWVIQTIDTIPAGSTSIAIDSNGKVHISYYDTTNFDLKYATNSSGIWTTSTVDSAGAVGEYNAIALDSNNKAHISYYDVTNKDLKYATNASGSWLSAMLDTSGDVGLYTSIAADNNNKIHISYVKTASSIVDLRYITNQSGSWLASIIDSGLATYSSTTSIATDSANKPHIAYSSDESDFAYIKHATNASGSWVTEVVRGSLEERDGYSPSVAIDSGDKVHIGYRQVIGPSRGAKYATNATGSWVVSQVELVIHGFHDEIAVSLALDASDNPRMAYYHLSKGAVHYAVNSSGSWNVSELDRALTYDPFISPCIAVGPDNSTHMAKPTKQGTMVYAQNMAGNWTAEMVEGVESAGDCYMTVDSGDKAHISYSDTSASGVKYATNTSGAWLIEAIESGTAGIIKIDSNDNAHMIYKSAGKPKYATNASGSWVKEIIDSNGENPKTLRIDSNGNAHAVFTNTAMNIGIYYATNASGAWNSTFVHNDPNFDEFVLDSNNKIHAARSNVYDFNVYYATNASGAWVEEFASGGYNPWPWYYDDAGVRLSLSVDSKNKAHIVYSWYVTSTGTAGTIAELVYTTNAYGFWLDIRSLPGDLGKCFRYAGSNICLAYSNYPLAMNLDSNNYIHYIVGSPSFGYGSYNSKFLLSTGYEHTLLIKPDGTLWTWGHNNEGQLGDGTRTDSLSPVQIGTDNDWAAVSAGWQHSVALKNNSTLWAWGDNDYGQLGDGTTTDRLLPVQIGSDTNWVQVAAGGAHNLALKSNGTLWAWGLNSVGQLGDGTTTTRLSAVQIGSSTDWRAISAGWEHSAAVKSNKDLYTWGWNSEGQLGDGTTINKGTPIKVGSGFTPDISAGWQHTMALMTNASANNFYTNRSLYGWGYNEYGQLGDGTTTDSLWPKQIGSYTDWSAVAAGGAHTVGMRTNGMLYAWGGNWQGQVGDGTTTMRTSPFQIGSDTDWTVVSAGWEHSSGLKNGNSNTLTWGWNEYGQLGDGTTDDSYSPEVIDKVKIAGTSLYYFLVQNAYDDAISGDAVLSRALSVNGDLYADRDIAVTLDGGYDAGFSMITGMTTLNGNIIISNGTVTIGNLIVQ